MDTMTDILSTFFVSKPQKRQKHREQVLSERQQVVREQVSEEKKRESSHDTFTDTTIADLLNTSEASTTSATSIQETVEPAFRPKKYALRAIDIYKKNTVIANTDIEDCVASVSDILHSLSLMKNVMTMYTKSVNVITSPGNKGIYRKMILDNPYMQFTDFEVKHTLPKSRIEELIVSKQRSIVIIDDIANLVKYSDLIHTNVHMIVIATDAGTAVKAYKMFGTNNLLIHKLDRLKSLQKTFFKKILQPLCADLKNIEFETFFHIINQKNFGVRHLIVKNSEFRYY